MTTNSDWPPSNTDHGLLVAFGEFLQQHGLLQRLKQVPVEQKTMCFAPASKLIEFLAGLMSGMEYLSDLNDGPHPLAKDSVVAHAWGAASFAHYSSVSRTLAACDDDTLSAVQQAIEMFSRPFIRTAVHELMQAGSAVVFDLDLMGQPVSATSTAYPDVAFGWMNESVQLGYQVARICFTTRAHERLWLSGFHHPGDTVSANCLQELIRGAEAQTGVRPRRRTELVRQRISAHAHQMRRPQRLLAQQRAQQAHQQQTHTRLREQIFQAEQAQKMPISVGESSRLAQRCQRWQARLARLDKQLATAEHVIARHQHYLHQLTQTLAQLQNWLHTLEADNCANPDPPLCEARMDSGFSSGSNLTWLIEMGYQVNSKAVGGLTTAALRKTLAADASWTRVGDNAEMLVCPRSSVHDCPYTLRLALERFKVRDAYQYATLLQFRDDGQACTLPDWFHAYNARQTIEAGNKESKSGVFHVQHLMSRSPAGIRLQVMFATLAANVMQWCRPWLRKCATQPTAKLLQTFNSPKHMVRVAANCAARVQQTTSGTSLQFAPTSALPGAILVLEGVPAFQLPLSLSFVVQNCN
jgi:hypothetical protein